jgi:hypothetical protein
LSIQSPIGAATGKTVYSFDLQKLYDLQIPARVQFWGFLETLQNWDCLIGLND